jgi:hypothetical protein
MMTGNLLLMALSPADLRWFWSITVYEDPKAGIVTARRWRRFEEAKAAAWRRRDQRP